jgi:hypothetical protein
MSYLSAKKIYPGNQTSALNGWYKNIDTTDDGTNDSSLGGPTSVLAIPGYRYFQQRGYVEVGSGSTAVSGVGNVIVPSPYRNDDTRPDITGMVISGSSTQPAYIYRAAISVASGWGDDRVASGVYSTSAIISFGRNNSGAPTAASGVGEGVAQANLASGAGGFYAAGDSALSSVPVLTATGAAGVTAGNVYRAITSAETYSVFTKATANATATGAAIQTSSDDAAAGLKGYLVVEACYFQADSAPGYEDIEAYIPARTVS